MVATDWKSVPARLARIRESGRAERAFGSRSHEFRLRPRLSSDELAEAEAQFGIAFPEEYRDFLQQVGAGGAGPFHGIFPLIRSAGRWRWEGDGAELTDVTRLKDPFAEDSFPREVLEIMRAERPPREDTARFDAWLDRWETALWSRDRTIGAVCLCHEGCALRRWLIVNGPHRGEIWIDHRADDVDLTPMADQGPVGFGQWYQSWLDEVSALVLSTT